jgi:hypothetical protein
MKETIKMINNRITYVSTTRDTGCTYTISYGALEKRLADGNLSPDDKKILSSALQKLVNVLYREGEQDVFPDDDEYMAATKAAAQTLRHLIDHPDRIIEEELSLELDRLCEKYEDYEVIEDITMAVEAGSQAECKAVAAEMDRLVRISDARANALPLSDFL